MDLMIFSLCVFQPYNWVFRPLLEIFPPAGLSVPEDITYLFMITLFILDSQTS